MLGRGLDSLIPKKDLHTTQEHPQVTHIPTPALDVLQKDAKDTLEPVFHIEIEKIKSNPHQPRKEFNPEHLKELSASIREFGVIQPIVVSKVAKETPHGTDVEYQLIVGERRLMASKLAGLPRIPAIIRKVDQDRENLELAIIENIQRAELNAIESARAYAKLQEMFGLTQREIAIRVGKSREVIANTMRLLNLPTHIQEAISKSQITESQGRMILAVSTPDEQQKLFENIIEGPRRKPYPRARGVIETDPELVAAQNTLQEFLGTKVHVQKSKEGGKIVIDFYSKEELDGIMRKWGGSHPS